MSGSELPFAGCADQLIVTISTGNNSGNVGKQQTIYRKLRCIGVQDKLLRRRVRSGIHMGICSSDLLNPAELNTLRGSTAADIPQHPVLPIGSSNTIGSGA